MSILYFADGQIDLDRGSAILDGRYAELPGGVRPFAEVFGGDFYALGDTRPTPMEALDALEEFRSDDGTLEPYVVFEAAGRRVELLVSVPGDGTCTVSVYTDAEELHHQVTYAGEADDSAALWLSVAATIAFHQQ